jgi:septum formation protein
LIVASDTVVELKGRIFGKPRDKDDAREMLLTLGGKTHNVVTAVFLKAIFDGEVKEKVFSVKTQVKFHEIREDILDPYIESKESLDKAGAYGIQGKGLTFVESLKGSYSNVVGFPLVEFLDELKVFLGRKKSDVDWRNSFK